MQSYGQKHFREGFALFVVIGHRSADGPPLSKVEFGDGPRHVFWLSKQDLKRKRSIFTLNDAEMGPGANPNRLPLAMNIARNAFGGLKHVTSWEFAHQMIQEAGVVEWTLHQLKFETVSEGAIVAKAKSHDLVLKIAERKAKAFVEDDEFSKALLMMKKIKGGRPSEDDRSTAAPSGGALEESDGDTSVDFSPSGTEALSDWGPFPRP